MTEIHEFRIFKDYYPFLKQPNTATFNGMVYVLKIAKDDPVFDHIGTLEKEIKATYNKHLFGFWDVSRKYSKIELAEAKLFHVTITSAFEPTGEECGTDYDETTACEFCGANRKQKGPLKLKRGSIPKRDIARTIAGEVVVSEKFADAVKRKNLHGIAFGPVIHDKSPSNYFQLLVSSPELLISNKTIVGHNPFNLSIESSEETEFRISGGYKVKVEKQVYKCPNGHTLGPRLISEPYVVDDPSIYTYDFFVSRQKMGLKQGLLRPEPLYFCSKPFKKMVEEEKLSGFDFQICNVV